MNDDLTLAIEAMRFIRPEQLITDEDIFRFAGNCKYYGDDLEIEYLAIGLGHPKDEKFQEKWRHAKAYKSPGMIFSLAKENGYNPKGRDYTPIEKSKFIAVYDGLGTIDQQCKDYYIKRGLSVFPSNCRKSIWRGEVSIWVPFCQNGRTEHIGIHKTYINRTQRRKVISKGGQPENGVYANLGKIGNSRDIHITEGIETALAIMSAGIEGTFYSCLNSTNLKKFKPRDKGDLYIWGDRDKSRTGQKAATAAARSNFKDRKCFIVLPDRTGEDWNDILINNGKTEIRKSYDYAEVYYDLRASYSGRVAFDSLAMAKNYIKIWMPQGVLSLRIYRKEFHVFNGMCYIPFKDIETHVMNWLQDNKESYLKERKELETKPTVLTKFEKARLSTLKKATPATSKQAVSSLLANLDSFKFCAIPHGAKMPCFLDEDFTPSGNSISFSNGKTLLIDDYLNATSDAAKDSSLIETTPKIFNRFAVDYPYVKEECPLWLNYLRGVQPDADDRENLQMLMGLMLIPDASYNVLFFLCGPSGTGKSQFLDVLKGVVGKFNVCSVQPHMMVERFQTKILTEKLVNVVGDLASTAEGRTWSDFEGVLKDRASGGDVPTEVKGDKDISVSPNMARDIFATNSMPYFADTSNGIWDRVRIINFNVNFRNNEKEKIPEIAKLILKTESPGVFLWALEGLVKLKKLKTFPETKSGKIAKESHQKDCNPISDFLEDNYHFKEGEYIKCSVIFEAYKTCLSEQGMRSKNMRKFNKELLTKFPSVSRERRMMENKRDWYFNGLGMGVQQLLKGKKNIENITEEVPF